MKIGRRNQKRKEKNVNGNKNKNRWNKWKKEKKLEWLGVMLNINTVKEILGRCERTLNEPTAEKTI